MCRKAIMRKTLLTILAILVLCSFPAPKPAQAAPGGGDATIHRVRPIFKKGPVDKLKLSIKATMPNDCLYRWSIDRRIVTDGVIEVYISARAAIHGKSCSDQATRVYAEPAMSLKGLRPGIYTVRVLNEVRGKPGPSFRIELTAPECMSCLPRVRPLP